MFKFIYELIINPLGLPIEPVWEYIILLAVGEIVHEIAYWISPGGKEFGSIIYWISKFIVFVAIWAILYGIITAVQFAIAHWIWFTIGGVIILVTMIIIIIITKKKNKRDKKKNENQCN